MTYGQKPWLSRSGSFHHRASHSLLKQGDALDMRVSVAADRMMARRCQRLGAVQVKMDSDSEMKMFTAIPVWSR